MTSLPKGISYTDFLHRYHLAQQCRDDEIDMLLADVPPRDYHPNRWRDDTSKEADRIQQMESARQKAIVDDLTQLAKTLDYSVAETIRLFAGRRLRGTLFSLLQETAGSLHSTPLLPTGTAGTAETAYPSAPVPAALPGTDGSSPVAHAASASSQHGVAGMAHSLDAPSSRDHHKTYHGDARTQTASRTDPELPKADVPEPPHLSGHSFKISL